MSSVNRCQRCDKLVDQITRQYRATLNQLNVELTKTDEKIGVILEHHHAPIEHEDLGLIMNDYRVAVHEVIESLKSRELCTKYDMKVSHVDFF